MKHKLSVLFFLCLTLTLLFAALSSTSAARVGSGNVILNPSTVKSGESVTMTITPDPGCALKSITVTDYKGTKLSLTYNNDGTFTFIVPEGGITVQADFKQIEKDETIISDFTDVKSDAYYADAVAWAVETGITTGVNETTFAPEAFCTRGQVVTFLWRLAGCPEITSNNVFSDVIPGSYYEEAVKWAVANNITNGTGSTTFSPDAICTRAQIVTFLARYAHGIPHSLNNPFTDVASGTYYAHSVLWALENNITTGITSSSFAPDASCTRAQVITFLYRMAK